MTVGSDVKGCYFSIKSAEATLQQLAAKTNELIAHQAYTQASKLLAEAKIDLEKQVLFLAREEPQYK